MINLYESRYLGGRRSKALFWYAFIHGNAYVVDMDLGGISVTNDAENVVADLVSAVKATGPYEVRRIFYRDSAGGRNDLNSCTRVACSSRSGRYLGCRTSGPSGTSFCRSTASWTASSGPAMPKRITKRARWRLKTREKFNPPEVRAFIRALYNPHFARALRTLGACRRDNPLDWCADAEQNLDRAEPWG